MKDQLAIYKSIRKPVPPTTRVIRPEKGCGYRRPRNKKDTHATEE